MNLLLITFSFPPAGGVGVLRALSLAKYLPEDDVRVDVLTARNAPAVGKDLTLLRQVPTEVTVHRTWTLDLPFALRKAVKGLLTRGSSAPRTQVTPPAPVVAGQDRPPGAASQAERRSRSPLRRLLGNLLLPDPQIGWLPFARPAATRLIRRRHIDAVVVTVPPFSSAALVTALRRTFPNLPIVLDFRDEWLTSTLHLVSFNNNDRARHIAARTEAAAVRAATKVVLVTEAARKELLQRYPGEPSDKFVCIHNGFDTPPKPLRPPSHLKNPASRITLTYLGTVYGSTDPSTLIAAVRTLPDELRHRLRLRFIGHIERESYREGLTRLGDTVELRGFLPQAEALQAIEDTDFLLLITHDRVNVAAKFYDYLAGGRPILAAVHPDGEVRRLLERTGAGLWCDGADSAAIADLLRTVLSGPEATSALTPHPEQIARFHRRVLAHEYAALLHSLVPSTTSGPPLSASRDVPIDGQTLANGHSDDAKVLARDACSEPAAMEPRD